MSMISNYYKWQLIDGFKIMTWWVDDFFENHFVTLVILFDFKSNFATCSHYNSKSIEEFNQIYF